MGHRAVAGHDGAMSTPLLDQISERGQSTGIVRYRDGRMIGGVARGIAARFDIDPVVVRVGFVIALFAGGLGAALYLLGWLLLPDDTGIIPVRSAVKDHDAAAWGLLIGTGIVTLAAIVSLITGRDGARLLSALAIGALVWFFAHRWSGSPAGEAPGGTTYAATPSGAPPTTAEPAVATPASTTAATGAETGEAFAPGQGASVPGTTPVGAPMPVITPWSGRDGERAVTYQSGTHPSAYAAAPQATRVVAAPVVPPPRRRSLGWRIWLIGLGLATLAWTLSKAITVSTGHDELTANLVATGVTATVLGLLVLTMGLRGYRTSGLAVPTLLLALIAASGQSAITSGPDAGMGDFVWQPQSATELQSDYSVGMGTGRLDLSKVSAADLAGRTVAVSAGMGELEIKVPTDVRVEITPRVGLGEVRIADGGQVRTYEGFAAGNKETVVLGSGEQTVRLQASAGMGEIRVERVTR